MDYFTKYRTCIVCGKPFQEIDNLCKFECGTHPDLYENGKWLCCHNTNKNKKKYPCIKFDHYDKETKIGKYYPILTIDLQNEDKDLTEKLLRKIEPIVKKKNNLIQEKNSKIICKRSYFY